MDSHAKADDTKLTATFYMRVAPFRLEGDNEVQIASNEEVAEYVAEDFNQTPFWRVLSYVEKFEAAETDDPSRLRITAKLSRPITENEREKIASFLSGQCSDGWGEGLIQQELSGRLFFGEAFHFYVDTWIESENDNSNQ
jgi:hypothetical protein